MNLLQFFFIISWIIILIIAIDIARKQKFNALHFLVFIGVGSWLLTFTFFPNILNSIWSIFWVARWADVLVYTSIIFLLYFVLLLLTKHVQNRESITSLIRFWAINHSLKKEIKWKEVFLIRVYNEWEVLKWVLDKVIKKGYKNILVVNDGSTDDSYKILNDFWDKIILLNHAINRWAWAALETWFEYLRRYSKVDFVITFDSDWQHDLDDLSNFYKAFEKHPKLWAVLWSRFIKKTNSNVPFLRKIILFLWRILEV